MSKKIEKLCLQVILVKATVEKSSKNDNPIQEIPQR